VRVREAIETRGDAAMSPGPIVNLRPWAVAVDRILDAAGEQLCDAGRQDPGGSWADRHYDRPLPASPLCRRPVFIAGTSLLLGSWWGLVAAPIRAVLLALRSARLVRDWASAHLRVASLHRNDSSAGFIGQFAAFQLPKNVPTLRIDEQRLGLTV
jgi:hypothetical protein